MYENKFNIVFHTDTNNFTTCMHSLGKVSVIYWMYRISLAVIIIISKYNELMDTGKTNKYAITKNTMNMISAN